ncbi:protein transport protein Sec24C [Pseudomyrmex gracilis]|uniref:protein transport protein Sec24C n=1 Tax=Pseudomyrmex gracilis TaxID=219809 RepID=UPI000994A84D|nr:protein transport protein Sec24C [Pseudomyrmex gracilis]
MRNVALRGIGSNHDNVHPRYLVHFHINTFSDILKFCYDINTFYNNNMQHIQEMNRQHPYAAPVSLVNNQQNMSKSPIMGQQNLSNSQMQPHLLPVQSMDHSQPNPLATGGVSSQMSPHLHTGLHGHSANYQTQMTNSQNNSLPQSEVELYNSAPPPSQTAGSPIGSGLLQSEVRQYAPPVSTMGQSMASPLGSNPVLPQARYKLHSQPISSVPGQTVASPTGPGLVQSGQFNTAPPISGQNLPGSLGMNRVPPGTISGYQQPTGYQQTGYHNQMDMYNNQRNLYPNTPNATGYQPGLQPQQARRLDPEQMPSPIQVMQDDQNTRGGIFITNQRGLVPPLVTTNFITQDQGNASPRYIRSTMYTVPTTADIIKQTNVPFGLVISPMARVVQGECEPPIVDMGEIGPVRCIRCKAYMCPFMQFIDAGRRFQCMFCKATTEVPNEYFQHLDHTGQRIDRCERPELMFGTFEYIATKDYCRDNVFPKPPAIVFIIDVSYNTVKSGLVSLLCAKMKSIIKNLPIDAGQTKSNMKVGFITYNNTVHFYNINPCLGQPQMMVVGDVQDVFMPLLDGFLCNIEESEAVIDSLMTQIPQMFADTRETETILAPAIQAGLEALKASECSGKLLIFHSSLPIAEAPGKLKNRDDRKVLGTDKEKTVLVPQSNVYNNLGQECVGAGCSVDLFIFNNSYVDIATIGQICRLTGGEIYKYTYFQAEVDGDRLISDVINNISRPIAFDAVMRVRTSTGVRATDFYGHYFMSNTTDMELASIDCDKAIAIEVKHDDKLTDDEGVYIQVALLYTSCSGVRRLRIINLSLKTSSQMAELYRACDLDAIINYFSKQSVFKLLESAPKAVKDNLIARCANMLAVYRKHCATPSSAGQLILPECMKLLPLCINCLLKSDALSGGSDMTIDDRSYVMQAVTTMPISISIAYIYPRLFPLHDVDSEDTYLPPMLRCSIDKFADDGAYLLENTIHMFLWLGMALSSQWVQSVFGVPSVVQIDTDRSALPILDTPLNNRIINIINRIRAERHRCMKLTIVRQRDKLEMVLRHFLVEDRGNDGSPSYVDFLCHMHKEIRTILSQ